MAIEFTENNPKLNLAFVTAIIHEAGLNSEPPIILPHIEWETNTLSGHVCKIDCDPARNGDLIISLAVLATKNEFLEDTLFKEIYPDGRAKIVWLNRD